MKKLFSILLLVLSLSLLTGCIYRFPSYSENTTAGSKSTTTGANNQGSLDMNSMVEQIYSSVYAKAEQSLYSQIYSEIRSEFIDGKIDYEVLQQRIYEVIQTSGQANVLVTNYKYSESAGTDVGYATGSGVIFEKEDINTANAKYRYYFITNHHVVEDGNSFSVTFADESQISATLVGSDATTDIALLYFDSSAVYQVAPLGDSSKCKIGEFVVAIGNPKGQSLFGTATLGIVGGLGRHLIEDGATNTINSYIQHDAAINSGNSGGGLFNLDGECVGINSVKYASSEIEGLNFAIPINLVKDVVYELKTVGFYSGKVSFGIQVTEVSALTALGRSEYKVPDSITSGVLIIEVDENKSAYGKLEPYDIILSINGTNILSTNDVAAQLALYRIGDTVQVKVLRNGVETVVDITFKR